MPEEEATFVHPGMAQYLSKMLSVTIPGIILMITMWGHLKQNAKLLGVLSLFFRDVHFDQRLMVNDFVVCGCTRPLNTAVTPCFTWRRKRNPSSTVLIATPSFHHSRWNSLARACVMGAFALCCRMPHLIIVKNMGFPPCFVRLSCGRSR